MFCTMIGQSPYTWSMQAQNAYIIPKMSRINRIKRGSLFTHDDFIHHLAQSKFIPVVMFLPLVMVLWL